MFETFKPTVWAANINTEMQKKLIFAVDCNREYDGLVKEHGDQVKILSMGSPTIHTVTLANRNASIDTAEQIEDSAQFLQIDQLRTYNIKVGDIDRQFAVGGWEAKRQQSIAYGLANEIDTWIAKMAQSDQAHKMTTVGSEVIPTTTSTDAAYILKLIDNAQQWLWENNVPKDTQLYMTVTPRFYMILRRAYILVDTDNSQIIRNGYVGKYGNIIVRLSNNVATASNAGLVDYIMLRTQEAISWVNPLSHSEPYRHPDYFVDFIKGFELFGGKIVKPKEICVINVKYA